MEIKGESIKDQPVRVMDMNFEAEDQVLHQICAKSNFVFEDLKFKKADHVMERGKERIEMVMKQLGTQPAGGFGFDSETTESTDCVDVKERSSRH